MTNQRIIIVGASSGIGQRMAELYACMGMRVGITGRREELLKSIRDQYPQLMEYACFDVTAADPVTPLQELINKLGGLDILVISAGTGEPSKDLNWEIDKRTVDTNVNGFVRIANWGFNFFSTQGHGQLVTISSIAAVRGGHWAPAYNASKSFQSSYFDGLWVKAKKLNNNVHVTCIEPGFVATKMAKSDKLFWVVPVDKAARQIIRAIEKKKRKAYISRRWRLVAFILRSVPHWIYRKLA